MIALDFDGTIVNSMDDLTDVAIGVLRKYYGLATVAASILYAETVGQPFNEQLDAIFPRDVRNRAAADEFAQLKVTPTLAAEPFPDAVQFIKMCQDDLIVISSTEYRLIDQWLDDNNFPDRVDVLTESKLVGLRLVKPDLYVGDATLDATYAGVAGVKFMGVRRNRRHLKTHIPHVTSLIELL